jgi:hypothetical protein
MVSTAKVKPQRVLACFHKQGLFQPCDIIFINSGQGLALPALCVDAMHRRGCIFNGLFGIFGMHGVVWLFNMQPKRAWHATNECAARRMRRGMRH